MPHPVERSEDQEIGAQQLGRLIDLQKEELAIRRDEADLRREELHYNHEFAHASLKAQQEDRRDARMEYRRQRRDGLYFLGFVLLAFLAFFAILVVKGHQEFAMELLKVGVYFGTGSTGGYYVGKYRGEKNAERVDG